MSEISKVVCRIFLFFDVVLLFKCQGQMCRKIIAFYRYRTPNSQFVTSMRDHPQVRCRASISGHVFTIQYCVLECSESSTQSFNPSICSQNHPSSLSQNSLIHNAASHALRFHGHHHPHYRPPCSENTIPSIHFPPPTPIDEPLRHNFMPKWWSGRP